MKKIAVAGAGHGGLVAAALLSKAGYDVEVFEKCKREELGHDWEDRFTFSLLEKLGIVKESGLPAGCWRYRGDCAFVSPAKRKKVVIRYSDENRQRIMERKALIGILLDYAEKSGVKLNFSCEVISPLIENGKVAGIKTAPGDIRADLVIDAAGVFSPVRMNLPESLGIEKEPRHGDLFYAYRAYYNRLDEGKKHDVPFEVYMYHEGEQGLSWFCTNPDSVDILIGRTDPINDKKVAEQLALFRADHPWLGDKIKKGGTFGIIPVRRPLTLMVSDGYAAVGDSAFMTTPMNGMGIDLSLLAGELLAKTVIASGGDCSIASLWNYNRDFHTLYGGDTAKNEGLKNAILSLPSVGVDFLFESEVIQSSDLAGAGHNTSLPSLLGKFVRGMKQPQYFFTLLGGLIKGSKASGAYKKAPAQYSAEEIAAWSKAVASHDIRI